MKTGSLMKVESIAECSIWSILQYFWPVQSILQYFWPALSDYSVLKTFLVFFESGRFTQVLLHAYWKVAQ